jgi:hypothetical protein
MKKIKKECIIAAETISCRDSSPQFFKFFFFKPATVFQSVAQRVLNSKMGDYFYVPDGIFHGSFTRKNLLAR